jgi:hypothetical protein
MAKRQQELDEQTRQCMQKCTECTPFLGDQTALIGGGNKSFEKFVYSLTGHLTVHLNGKLYIPSVTNTNVIKFYTLAYQYLTNFLTYTQQYLLNRW